MHFGSTHLTVTCSLSLGVIVCRVRFARGPRLRFERRTMSLFFVNLRELKSRAAPDDCEKPVERTTCKNQ